MENTCGVGDAGNRIDRPNGEHSRQADAVGPSPSRIPPAPEMLHGTRCCRHPAMARRGAAPSCPARGRRPFAWSNAGARSLARDRSASCAKRDQRSRGDARTDQRFDEREAVGAIIHGRWFLQAWLHVGGHRLSMICRTIRARPKDVDRGRQKLPRSVARPVAEIVSPTKLGISQELASLRRERAVATRRRARRETWSFGESRVAERLREADIRGQPR